MIGSLPYMPPEQFLNSRDARPAYDLYAAGASLYHWLSGRTPHDFPAGRNQFLVILEDAPVPLADRVPDMPLPIATVVDRALARAPEQRYASAAELKHAIKEATGAPTYGFGPHAGGKRGEAGVEEGGDWDFAPDIVVRDGEEIDVGRWRFTAVHTPGHTSNHTCFALREESTLFTGDHVMGWSTTVITPPDGDMRAYCASLEKLLRRDDAIYRPTHGGPITEPRPLPTPPL